MRIKMFKFANGDMIQYYMDNPKKLKEKLKRDKKRKPKHYIKTADLGKALKNSFSKNDISISL